MWANNAEAEYRYKEISGRNQGGQLRTYRHHHLPAQRIHHDQILKVVSSRK